MTTTARTLVLLRRWGFVAAVVEKWIPKIDRRQDLFGFADVLAIHPRQRVFLLVQATTAGHVSHRLTKARSKPELAACLATGGTFEVWGWERRADRWHVRRIADNPDDLEPVELNPRPRRRGKRTL